MRLGYSTFGVQRQGLCATGPRAHVTYKMYGRSNRCRNGKGAKWANTVYTVSGGSPQRPPVKAPSSSYPSGRLPQRPPVKVPSSSYPSMPGRSPQHPPVKVPSSSYPLMSGRSPQRPPVKVPSSSYPTMSGAPTQHEPITTDIAFLLDGFSYVGPQNFNQEKAFARSISRYVAMKTRHLRIGVATYGSRARLQTRFQQHCNLKQALESFNYIQFPEQTGRRVDRALKASFSYFFPGRVNHCFTSRFLVVVVGGRQTERPMAILKGLQQLPMQLRRHGVRVYVVVVGEVGAVIRQQLQRITNRNGGLYVVRSFRKLASKVGAITWSIRRRMRRQQIYQQRRCLPGSRIKGRVRSNNAKLIKRRHPSIKRQNSHKDIEI